MRKNYLFYFSLQIITSLLLFSYQYSFAQSVSFDSGTNATWNVPAGATQVTVEVWGGGASGGGSTVNGYKGGGGGGGGYISKTFDTSGGGSFTYTVGASVAGGTGSGTNGNDSSVTYDGITITAYGGKRGISGSALNLGLGTGGLGGSGLDSSGLSVPISGIDGTDAISTLAGDGGAGGAGGDGGIGGAEGFSGQAGSIPGGGGGGGWRQGGNRNGGAGANGLVIFTYIIPGNPSITFTTGTAETWTVPCGTTTVTAKVWGGGGSGGGTTSGNNKYGGGGGGGGYIERVFDTSAGGSFTYTVGGTTAGTSASNGSTGTTTTLTYSTITLTANGGAGGTADAGNNAGGGAGGTANDSSGVASGVNGTTGGNASTAAKTSGAGGQGGGSGGFGGALKSTVGNGNTGTPAGGGGSGALGSTGGARTGGTGARGQIVLEFEVDNTRWNGATWSNGAPDGAKYIYFDDDFSSTGDLDGCGCAVTAGSVVINSGHTLDLEDELVVSGGTLTFENNASLVQVNDNGLNSGSITFKRDSQPMYAFDFTYWSSPVSGFNISGISGNLRYGFNPGSQSWYKASGDMGVGQGYIIRTNNSNKLNAVVTPVDYIGTPNNGDISIGVSVGTTDSWNLLGNPYPSALDAELFLSDSSNAAINGEVYLWTHNTRISNLSNNSVSGSYSDSDYAIYNLMGGVSAASGGGTPTGYIASGQAFFVEAIAGGTATFTNAMRVAGNNSQFFKTSKKSSALPKNRLWLNMSNEEGYFKQILLGYVANATDRIDRGYDSKTASGNNVFTFYSIYKNAAEPVKLAIQGKGLPFHYGDEITLGFKVSSKAKNKIEIEKFEGTFEKINIYLEDKYTGSTHNLKYGPYEFESEVGTFDDRFVIHYQNKNLSVDENNTNTKTKVFAKNQHIQLESSEVISNIAVHNQLGALIYSSNIVNRNVFYIDSISPTNSLLIFSVNLQNGEKEVLKIIY